MKCSRCATEVAATATTCPQCGAKLNTEPVSSFSYLPPGTPPWPTYTPQHVPNVVIAEPGTAGASSVATKTRKGRSAGGVIGSIAVLVLAPIIGIAIVFATLYGTHALPGKTSAPKNASSIQATPTTTSRTTTPANRSSSVPNPTSFKTAKDNNVNVSLQYPGDWTFSTPAKSTQASAISMQQDKIGIDVIVQHFTDTFSASIPSAQQLNQAFLQNLTQTQGVQNLQSVQATDTAPVIGGSTWQASEATFTDTQGIQQHFITLSVQHGKSYYTINILVPDNLYQDALNKYFKPMYKSVKFLS